MMHSQQLEAANGPAPLAGQPNHLRTTIPSDAQFDTLWREYAHCYYVQTRMNRRLQAAEALLPWWAKPGPKYLHADGSISGDVSSFPAIQDAPPPSDPAIGRLIRPSPHELKSYWIHPLWGDKGREALERELNGLDKRLAAQSLEEEKIGLPAIRVLAEDAEEKRWNAKWQIYDLPPVTPAITAAQLLLDCLDFIPDGEIPAHVEESERAEQKLHKILPYLTGRIAHDVAIFLHNIEIPFGPAGYELLGSPD